MITFFLYHWLLCLPIGSMCTNPTHMQHYTLYNVLSAIDNVSQNCKMPGMLTGSADRAVEIKLKNIQVCCDPGYKPGYNVSFGDRV